MEPPPGAMGAPGAAGNAVRRWRKPLRDQSSIVAITAPADTVSPATAARPVMVPGPVRGERLLHLHRFEHDDEVTFGNNVAFGDGHLDDGALHGGGEGVAAGGRGRAAGTGALLGLGRLGAAAVRC